MINFNFLRWRSPFKKTHPDFWEETAVPFPYNQPIIPLNPR
ncbi:hypothetical protein [Microcoleus sp. AR_TQ3_B6]